MKEELRVGRPKSVTARVADEATRLLARDDLMGALFVVTLALLLAPGGGVSLPVYDEGTVSPRDVLAPRDFRVLDREATERERAKRSESVPLTFDFDRRPLGVATQIISQVFDAGRKGLQAIEILELSRTDDTVSGGTRSQPVSLALLYLLDRSDIPSTLSPDVVLALHRYRFDAAHEESLLRVLRTVLGKRIAPLSTDEIEELKERPIMARDLESGEEVKVRGIEEIFTLEQARRFLASEMIPEADLWDRPTRALLEGFLSTLLRDNFSFNRQRYEQNRRNVIAAVPLLYAEVKKGEKIVGRGEKVGEGEHQKLVALAEVSQSQWSVARVAGLTLLLTFFAYGLWRYVDYHQQSEKRVENLYAMVVLTFLSSAVVVQISMIVSRSMVERFEQPPYNVLEPYLFLAPYAVGSLILTLLVDSEIAMVFAVTFSLIAGLLADPAGDYTVALYALLAGFGAIYFTGPYLRRSTVLKSGGAISAASAVVVLGVSLQRGTWDDAPLLVFAIACALASGLLAATVVQLLLPLFETLFGILTDLKLSELMSANHPLISELALRAPGTYNHSIIVGTLAEAAAKAVGVSPVFMRTAAYYHDIGKMKMPEYFIENQRGGVNRHDKLAPSLSALIVRSHVKDGIEMGRAHGLPEELIEMIPAHHGTRLLAYFYGKAKTLENQGRSTVNEADYRYPGPRPRNKEGGIMMMCDAVEAAARSLQDPTSQKFQNVIDKMTETIYLDGQLDGTNLTLNDVQAIKEAFHKVLLSIYHHRIHYPGFDFEKRVDKRTSRTPRPDGEPDAAPNRPETGSSR